MTVGFSRILALFLGIVTPVLETIRRWNTWQENPPAMFDDYVLGGFLLYGAWRVGRDPVDGQRFLAAAWGVALGMVFLSFFGQLSALSAGPSVWHVVQGTSSWRPWSNGNSRSGRRSAPIRRSIRVRTVVLTSSPRSWQLVQFAATAGVW